jgi:hypothetical protein
MRATASFAFPNFNWNTLRMTVMGISCQCDSRCGDHYPAGRIATINALLSHTMELEPAGATA